MPDQTQQAEPAQLDAMHHPPESDPPEAAPHEPGKPEPGKREPSKPMGRPLRRTPTAFRWWLAGLLLALVGGFTVLLRFAPGPDLATIVSEPGAITLLALILLADVYPTLPWMRDSNQFDDYILSTPLALAALIVYGPHAALVFVAAGLAMTMALRMVWWRVLLNAALLGLQGLITAATLIAIMPGYDWAVPMTSGQMLAVTIVLAVVFETSNVLLVTTSLCLSGASTISECLSDGRRQVAISTLALTAPIPAVLAAQQPMLLPLLALAMVAAQSGMGAVASRTQLAGTDPLTSVANRLALLARLKSRLARLPRPGESVTLLLVDLDRFKQINDAYGHLAGDRVLIEVARRLEESTRSADLVARFGGDEFAILLAGDISGRTVDDVADRIRQAVARPIDVQERAVLVEVSIGSAVAADRGVDALSLIQQADVALYRIKSERHRRAHEPPAGWRLSPDPARGEIGRRADGGPGPGRPAVGRPENGVVGDSPVDQGPDEQSWGWAEPAWSTIRADPLVRAAAPSGQRA
jgi:diguanylate cyclase (GGDEF)-like protein